MARDRVGLREWLESSTWASGSRTVRALGSGLAMRRKPGALLSAGQESETKCSAELPEKATRSEQYMDSGMGCIISGTDFCFGPYL
jgi:hypothetical protein